MSTILIFASGNGSNAEKIITYFKERAISCRIEIFTNNPYAKIIDVAKRHQLNIQVFDKTSFYDNSFEEKILRLNPDLIVLAGFLWLFPKNLVAAFPNKIINIHPALLPKYGGKGMYGRFVHEAVFQNKEKVSGITIHYVTENYDEGAIIQQVSTPIEGIKSSEEIAKKIQKLEHEHYPIVIEKLIKNSL